MVSLTYPQIQALIWLESFAPQSKKNCLGMKISPRVLTGLQLKRMIVASFHKDEQVYTLTDLGSMYTHNIRVLTDLNMSFLASKIGNARDAEIVRLGKQVAKGLAI